MAQHAIQAPLRLCIAGITCTDYSPLGQQSREAGAAERHAAVWLEERRWLASEGLEDIYIAENSERYPAEGKQGDMLAGTHKVVVVRTGPLEQGFPVRRKRTFMAGIHLADYVWCGPDTLEDMQSAFERLFHRQVQLTGDIYFHASGAPSPSSCSSVLPSDGASCRPTSARCRWTSTWTPWSPSASCTASRATTA